MTEAASTPAVVAGVDGSENALRAVRWAGAEAARTNATLRLVSAFDRRPEALVAGPGIRTDMYRRVLWEHAEEQLGSAAAIARREFPGIDLDQQLVEGSPSEVLLREGQRAQLLVVGDKGLTRVEGLLLGSVAVAVATNAVCPVVVVRGVVRDRAHEARLPVVVGVDTSMPDDSALRFAVEAAAARRVPLVAVSAAGGLPANPVLAPLFDHEAIEEQEQRLLGERLAGCAETYPDVTVERVVTRSRPVPILLEEARRAQLVVVGSRGRSELAGLFLGSVGNALVHRSPCPVAVVPSVADGGDARTA